MEYAGNNIYKQITQETMNKDVDLESCVEVLLSLFL